MKGYFSIVKYYPSSLIEDGFSIGLIVVSDDKSGFLFKVSTERINRIKKAYGVKQSELLEFAIEELKNSKLDYNKLKFRSIYENGILRYTEPKPFVYTDINIEFNKLFELLVLGEDKDETSQPKKLTSSKLKNYFRKILLDDNKIKKSVNISYDFKDDQVSNLLIGKYHISFIGANGEIYAGELIDFSLSELSIQQNLFKTLAIFEALEKTYPENFAPEACNFLVVENDYLNSNNKQYLQTLKNWKNKAGYNLLVSKRIEDFIPQIRDDVEKKSIIPYTEWINKLESKKLV